MQLACLHYTVGRQCCTSCANPTALLARSRCLMVQTLKSLPFGWALATGCNPSALPWLAAAACSEGSCRFSLYRGPQLQVALLQLPLLVAQCPHWGLRRAWPKSAACFKPYLYALQV